MWQEAPESHHLRRSGLLEAWMETWAEAKMAAPCHANIGRHQLGQHPCLRWLRTGLSHCSG